MTVFDPEAYFEIRRGLFDPTLGYDGTDWGREVLEPWMNEHRSVMAVLGEVGQHDTAAQVLEDTDRWAL